MACSIVELAIRSEMAPRKESVSRQRRPTPKVRTGCLTCKLRRVKCGEELPFCHRCIKFGIQCEGYPRKGSGGQPTVKDQTILRRYGAIHTFAAVPITPRFGTDQEQRYFDIFCSKTAFEILPSFDTDFVRQMLLQACESETAIRHAVVAIGALDKTSETARNFDKLSFEGHEDAPYEHHRNALKEYTKAVRQMRIAASSGELDLRTTLLKCLVIMCFESWNGSQQLAVQQIQAGIALIHEWRLKNRTKMKSLTVTDLLSATPLTIEDHLILIFSQLAMQVVFFAETGSSQTRQLLENEIKWLDYQMPMAFSSLREAMIYHRFLTRRAGGFIAKSAGKEFAAFLTPEAQTLMNMSFFVEQEVFLADILHWFRAFEPLASESEGDQWKKSRIMQAQLWAVYLSLSSIAHSSETAYDSYNDVFEDINSLAEDGLTAGDKLEAPKTANFSSETGVVVHLYMVAMKCRDRTIRRKAISLLLSSPRREGIWDSVFAGRVAAWVVQLEEDFLDGDYVPDWARIQGVTWKCDLNNHNAVLTCRQRVSALSEEVRVRTKSISW